MKKPAALLMSLVLLLCLTACGSTTDTISSIIKGDVTGKIGKTYSTQWFDFSIDSITSVDSYEGEAAPDGYQFVDVVITEKNTFDEEITMGTFDFYMDADELEEYEWILESWHSSMMPEEFILSIGETVQYHAIFMLPVEITDIRFIYEEINELEELGATFTIQHTLNQ